MTASAAGRLHLRALGDRRTLDDFVRVPWSVYADDPAWVPPLLFERKGALAASQPVFTHLEWAGWVAYRDDRPVGRITAQIDRLHIERYQDATGFFGFIDACDDSEVFTALFAAAEDWLRARGMCRVRGPFGFNINQEVGLLVEGFDTRPFFMMTHARPYYATALERAGYAKAVDLFAYLISAAFQPPPVMATLSARLRRTVHMRPLDPRRRDSDLEILRDIFNDAWSGNWGFVPFTAEEFRTIGREMLMLIPPDFIQIAELDGEPVAFIVLLPNVNEAIADLDGNLLPFGWVRLLCRLKLGYPRTARIPLMGVRRRFHHTRLGPGLALSVVEALREPGLRKGLVEVEMSWILESNEAMKSIIAALGGRQSKRYRVYEKPLA
ncbi:MAG: N-acetyltransferase [Gammaproteobacteria bacterium]